MNMDRKWYTIIGVMGIIAQFLLPDMPVPEAWHKVVDKVPGCLGAIMLFLGRQAYGLNPDGSSAAIAVRTEETATKITVEPVPAKEAAKP